MTCQGCGTDQDVETYRFDLDLPTISACQLCIMLLPDGKMAERLGSPDPWAKDLEARPMTHSGSQGNERDRLRGRSR
jgi:hypothetical protein